jgi:hypothetical protein
MATRTDRSLMVRDAQEALLTMRLWWMPAYAPRKDEKALRRLAALIAARLTEPPQSRISTQELTSGTGSLFRA